MANDVTFKRFPWEPVPVEETLAMLQRDVAYMVTHTAVAVQSNRPELSMVVNTARGQIIPRNECKFRDGSTIEFQDIGMPQPGAPAMNVDKLVALVWSIVRELGLELQS